MKELLKRHWRKIAWNVVGLIVMVWLSWAFRVTFDMNVGKFTESTKEMFFAFYNGVATEDGKLIFVSIISYMLSVMLVPSYIAIKAMSWVIKWANKRDKRVSSSV